MLLIGQPRIIGSNIMNIYIDLIENKIFVIKKINLNLIKKLLNQLVQVI